MKRITFSHSQGRSFSRIFILPREKDTRRTLLHSNFLENDDANPYKITRYLRPLEFPRPLWWDVVDNPERITKALQNYTNKSPYCWCDLWRDIINIGKDWNDLGDYWLVFDDILVWTVELPPHSRRLVLPGGTLFLARKRLTVEKVGYYTIKSMHSTNQAEKHVMKTFLD
jgi:hypothetical protein